MKDKKRLTTLTQPDQFLPPEADKANHAGDTHRRFTGPHPQEAHREEEVPVGHKRQESQHDEALQGQEHR